MKKIIVLLTTIFILIFGIASSFGQTVSEEARRHFDYGMAAIEMAKSPADYEAAIKEFEQATKLAPDWPDAFYNLGLAQEGVEKFADAARSYRQYLRLAPDADDAEEIKSLINKLEYKAIPLLPISKGFMGIPWGASPEQIKEAMTGQGYRCTEDSSIVLAFRTNADRALYETSFSIKDNSLYSAGSSLRVRSPNPSVAQSVFNREVNDLIQEYGPPQKQGTEIEKDNRGIEHPWGYATWDLIDSRTSDKYRISIMWEVTWYSDMRGDNFVVRTSYTADSFHERLKKKDTSQPISLPQDINAKDQFGNKLWIIHLF